MPQTPGGFHEAIIGDRRGGFDPQPAYGFSTGKPASFQARQPPSSEIALV
jgi:hypothetical protein